MPITQVEQPTINPSSFEPENRQDGISGLMRVRNEAEFLAPVIESWINYVDELVIVFHQCTDNTPQIIEEFAQKYPEKIRAFHYIPHVYPFCTKEQVELDVNDIHSFVFYSNFGLSQTRYKTCVKIDGDHIGISEYLKQIYDFLQAYPLQNTALFFSGINLHQIPGDERYYINLKSPAVGDGDHAYWTVSPQNIFQKNPQITFCEANNFSGLNSYYLGFIYWHTNYLKQEQYSNNGGTSLEGEYLEKINYIETKNRDKKLVLFSPEFKEKNQGFQTIYCPKFKLYFDFGSLPDVTEIQPSNISQYLQIAIQHQQAKRLDLAEQIYHKILEKQPTHLEALYRLSMLMQQQGKSEEAENLLTKSVKIKPNFVTAWFSLGNLYQAQGELSAAANAYRQALTLEPKLVAIHNNLGYTLQQQGLFDEAVACYQKALEIQPNCGEAEVNLGNVLHAQGKLSQEQQKHYAELNYKLGVSQTKVGDWKTAITYYQQAIALQPDLWEAHYNLGMIWQKQGELKQAIASYHQALKYNPHHWDIYTRLGQIYQLQNQITEAISIYRQGLTLLNPHYAKAVTETRKEILVTPPIPQTEVTVGGYQFPGIPPVTDPDKPRPFLTVVIPVYNRTEYLLECLASVLVQWTGAEEMEILVMDNASTLPLFDLVNSLGQGVIRYYRQQQNLGAIANYNAGIALSRGHWVHILHDDDCVVPGFYQYLQQSLATCPDTVGVACTGFEYINEQGEALDTGEVVSLYAENKGIMQNWLSYIGICGLVTVPAIVIRRTAHERLGGYHPEIWEIADWEIFKRFASFYDWWYEPGILARYREHTQKMTPQNWLSGRMAKAIRKAIEISDTYLPVSLRAEITAKARSQNFNYCLNRAAIPLSAGNFRGALSVLQEILKIDHSSASVAKLFAWLTKNEVAHLRDEIVSKLFSISEIRANEKLVKTDEN